MNVFILNTGRCGSTSIIEACRHITNYTSAHESRSGLLGEARLAYPPDHIEADNRLSWLLGRLDRTYGDDAVYVHLMRDPARVANSVVQRYSHGIILAYRRGILRGLDRDADAYEVSLDYCDTVTENIRCFLKDKSRTMEFHLEEAERDLRRMWDLIGAEGDFEAALAAMLRPHNATRKNKRYKKYRWNWWRQRLGLID